MQELFWFFLGGFVCLMMDRSISFYKKVRFLDDIKLLSLMLIGYAYQQWVTITAAKYIYLEANGHDEEHIKVLKNTDEADLLEWKKEAVKGLNESVPPHYRSALKIDGWESVVGILENHYMGVLQGDYMIKKGENSDVENQE
tara:strand:+ start:304 stop:729 length:426 start_codon:yes stop_codon:yes gene_type:complete